MAYQHYNPGNYKSEQVVKIDAIGESKRELFDNHKIQVAVNYPTPVIKGACFEHVY